MKKLICINGLKRIGKVSFFEVYFLEEVIFNEGLKVIKAGAFVRTDLLLEVKTPNLITKIDGFAFNCLKLCSVELKKTQ